MKQRSLIVLDFDHTIFNTTKLVQLVKEGLGRLGISEDEVDAKRQYIKECCVVEDIDGFAAALDHQNKAEIHNVIHQVIREHAADCIFSDVRSFIERHKKNFDIIILTQGDTELQSEKISHSDLPGNIPVHIITGEKGEKVKEWSKEYEEIFYFDDKAKHIDEVKQAVPRIHTYFMQREEDKPYADIPTTCECADHVVASLELSL